MRCPSFLPLSLPLLFSLTASLHAVELADLAGDWTLCEMETPTSLREVYFNTVTSTFRTTENSQDFGGPNEVLTNAFYPDALQTRIRTFAINTAGAVTGDETGQILGISGNRISYADGSELTTVYSNTTGDILLTSARDADQQEQALCLKRPASLTTAELAGDWSLFTMINPENINTSTDGGRLTDTFFQADSSNAQGNITIQSDGSFSGLFSGTITATGPGDAMVTTGAGSIPFKCNASKNLAYAVADNEDEAEYIVLVRKAAFLNTSDFAGAWRISAVQIPTSLTETYCDESMPPNCRQADSDEMAGTGEALADVFHTDPFELNRFQIQINASGTFTGSISGSLSAGPGVVSVTTGGETFSLRPNADKTFLIGIRTFDDAHELILGVKTSNTPAADFEEETDLQPVRTADSLILSWNSGFNVGLQQSGSLGGGWADVEEAGGTDAVAIDLSSGGTGFFRVTEQAE